MNAPPPAGVPHRWLWLALPDDCRQEAAIVDWMFPRLSPHTRRTMLSYRLRKLRHEVWDRHITRTPKAPSDLRPSKLQRAAGYRTDSARHQTARLKLPASRRRAIARKGQAAWRDASFSGRS